MKLMSSFDLAMGPMRSSLCPAACSLLEQKIEGIYSAALARERSDSRQVERLSMRFRQLYRGDEKDSATVDLRIILKGESVTRDQDQSATKDPIKFVRSV